MSLTDNIVIKKIPIIGSYAAWITSFSFSTCAVVAGLAIISGAIVTALSQSHFLYLLITISALLSLFIYGSSKLDDDPEFSATSAAEVIVALGIASVVFGLLSSLFSVLSLSIAPTDLTLQTLGGMFAPFGGGLFAAAVAPVLAVVLRYRENVSAAKVTHDADPTTIAAEFQFLSARIKMVAEDLGAVSKTLQTIQGDLKDASKEAIGALRGLGSAVKDQADLAGGALASLADAGIRASDGLKNVGTQLDEAGTSIAKFEEKVGESAKLLDGLKRILGAIERFTTLKDSVT